MNRLPNFVNMVSKCGSTTALRLVQIYGHKNLYGYYRDGGDWECGYIEKMVNYLVQVILNQSMDIS